MPRGDVALVVPALGRTLVLLLGRVALLGRVLVEGRLLVVGRLLTVGRLDAVDGREPVAVLPVTPALAILGLLF